MWEPRLIMVNGELIPFADARVHPLSLAVAYASTVFEGLRAYRHPGTGEYTIFRLAEHIRRLQVGMKVMRFDARYEVEEMRAHLSRQAPGVHPVLLCSLDVRRHLRKLMEVDFFDLPVLSYQELAPDLRIVQAGQVNA